MGALANKTCPLPSDSKVASEVFWPKNLQLETNIPDKGYFSSAGLTLQTAGKSTQLKKEKM